MRRVAGYSGRQRARFRRAVLLGATIMAMSSSYPAVAQESPSADAVVIDVGIAPGAFGTRAKAINNFLVANGINEKRLTYKGFGSTQPIFPLPEKDEGQRSANRRVEIMIVAN